MKLRNKEIAEIFGAFAVVASLMFVGLQLYLDRKVALADQYFNRGESAKEDRRSRLESDVYFQHVEESWALGWRPHYWDEESLVAKQIETGERSVTAVIAFELVLRMNIIGYDNLYYQYQQGLLNEESWNGMRSGLKEIMAENHFINTVYQSHSRANIQPVVEQIAKEIEIERATAMPSR
ncbi:MAG: hypothetical protein ABJ084_00505 [Halioglobus sp.]